MRDKKNSFIIIMDMLPSTLSLAEGVINALVVSDFSVSPSADPAGMTSALHENHRHEIGRG